MVMFASAATASARAGPDKTAAPTGYDSSRRASSSALIAEISASSCSISSPLRRYRRTTPARDAGTYRSRPRAAVFGAKKAYGPCGSPPAHRQPGLPHRRVCSVSEPDSTCSAPPSRAARARRRDSSRRVDRPARPAPISFFCSVITKEYAVARHYDQRPCSARVAAPSAASPSADSRPDPGGSRRSVHACGSVIWPLTPPAQTNTVSAPRRLAYKISSRCPFSGWNGWATMTKPKESLDNAALCRDRRNRQRPALGAARLGDQHLPRRHGTPRPGLQLAGQPGHPVLLDIGQRGLVDARRAVVTAHRIPRPLQDILAVDLVPQRMEPSFRAGPGRPVKHMLQCADPVASASRHGGPSRISGTHRSGPPSLRVNQAAALPSPQVVLSCRSDRYYGRLRLPPGALPASRLLTGYKTAHFHGHRAPASAGEGLPSSRRHLLNVPRPLRRTVPRGCTSRIFTASMAFTVIPAARHCLSPNDAAGFA